MQWLWQTYTFVDHRMQEGRILPGGGFFHVRYSLRLGGNLPLLCYPFSFFLEEYSWTWGALQIQDYKCTQNIWVCRSHVTTKHREWHIACNHMRWQHMYQSNWSEFEQYFLSNLSPYLDFLVFGENPFDLKLLLPGAARAISKRPAECQWWQLLKRLENKSSKMAAWVVCQHKKSIWTGCSLNWSPLSTLAPSDGVWKHDSLTPANQPLEVQRSRRALNENKSSPGNLQLKSLVMVMSNRNCF